MEKLNCTIKVSGESVPITVYVNKDGNLAIDGLWQLDYSVTGELFNDELVISKYIP